jgi:serine/threonine protein kinase
MVARMVISMGGYTADEPVAAGGSARVFRGHAGDGRVVALKVLDGPVDVALRRARREAALAAEVNHPHVLAVLDIVGDDTRVVVVTPFADGGTLAELLARRGELTVGEALTVLLPIAAAVATAHERGVVHGDLSPSNILFDATGRPVLADLGAARAAGELGEPVSATPGYVAPEVARGAPLTAAADLFSLGAVALHCLTGKPAWNADDLRDVVIQSTIGQWPDPGEQPLPATLVTALRGLLEADPMRRPGAAGLVVDLRRCGSPEPVDLALHLVRPASAPAPTVARPDAPPRPDPVRAKDASQRAARHRAARERWLPRTVTGVGVTGLVLLAVLGGLWWATWERPTPAAFGPVAATSTPTSPAATSSKAPHTMDTAPPPTTGPVPPTTTGPAPPTTAAGSSRTSTPATVRPAADVAGSDWLAVVRELDTQRAAALATADVARLDQVYTADATAKDVDARTIAALREHGLRVNNPAHIVVSAHRVAAPGTAVTVEVVDELPAYPVLDEAGRVVGTTPARASGRRLIDLVKTDGGYRISSISTS